MPLISKKAYLALILYILWIGYYTVDNYINTKNNIYQEVDKKLIQAAKTLPLIIPNGFHKQGMGKDTVSKEEDQKNIIQLSELADTVGLKYIYSLILIDEKINFSAASVTSEDQKTPHLLSTYFTHYDDSPKEIQVAFETGKIQFAQYSDKWGKFRSVFLPQLTQDNLLYISAADIEIGNIELLLKDSLFTSLRDSFWFILFIIPFIFFYFREIVSSTKRLELKVEERTKELNEKNEKLKQLASTDSMTHLFNRRHFKNLAEPLVELGKRDHINLSVIMIDIDNFKNVNDTHGHNVGDDVIIQLALLLQKSSRKSDVIARWGGEEFVILLPNTSNSGASKIAEKLRIKVENLIIPLDNSKEVRFTISIGISSMDNEKDNNIETYINRADKALYKAKESGKNKVCNYTQSLI